MVKYAEDKFDEDYVETVGVNFMDKTIELKRTDVTISLWDLPHARYGWETPIPLLCADAKCILFVFDLTRRSSLISIKRWYKEARKESKTFRPFLIGAKYDLVANMDDASKAEITRVARRFAGKMHAPLIYCSSLQSVNIKKIFKLAVALQLKIKPKLPEISDLSQGAMFEYEKATESDGEKEKDKIQKKQTKKKKRNKK